MFMSFPAVFRNESAANKAVLAYQEEEGDYEWTLLEKKDELDKMWYVPCRVKDYDYEVKAKGWVISP